METFWGRVALQLAVTLAISGVALGVRLGRYAPASRRGADIELTNSAVVAVLGLLTVLVGGVFLYAAFTSTVRPWMPPAGVAFVLLGAAILWEFVYVRHLLHADGLSYRTFFGRTGRLYWHQVTGVGYDPNWRWVRFRLADGRNVRVSIYLRGIPDLAQSVRTHVPPARRDESVSALLAAAAAGRPPV